MIGLSISVRLFRTLSFLLIVLLGLPVLAAGEWLPDSLHGFFDLRAGMRLQDAPDQRRTSLLEGRLQLETTRQWDVATLQLRGDFIADDVAEDRNLDLEEGSGPFDLREANLLLYPLDWADLKIGRQILTWGNGDLLFLNDLFPKDWQSFLSGRDTEYLKAPSDAVMLSMFPSWGTIDVVYTPRFDPDRYVRGERLAYYNPMFGEVVGREHQARVDKRKSWFSEDELALRLSRNLSGYETALYGYLGYWKSPVGFDMESGRSTFPRLNVWGGSVRGVVLGGVMSAEVAWYDSQDDHDGDDPLLPNSELRYLLGFERELATDLTGGVQWYMEQLLDYDAYRDHLAPGQSPRDRYRQLLTLRLTWLLLNQNLTASLFGFFSPSDQDFYLRPNLSYKITDRWQVSAGANLFGGDEQHTFFGQFEDNTNIYAGIRYSF